MEVQNLNEVMPKYKIVRNDREVVFSDNYEEITSEYNFMLGCIADCVTLKLMENGKVVKCREAK